MRRCSEMRYQKIWETRNRGLPIYDYYERVFRRWMRIFGPEFCIMPASRYYHNINFQGFTMLNTMPDQNGPCRALMRVCGVIPQFPTADAFERSVCSDLRDDFFAKVWIRGVEYRVCGRDKVRRLAELFTMYVVLAAPDVITDAMGGLARLMEAEHARK